MAITKYLVSALAVAGLAFAKGECKRRVGTLDTPNVMMMMMMMGRRLGGLDG